MKTKTAVVMVSLTVIGLPLAAAQSGALDKGPGMIGAGSPLYGLEVAMDNAAVNIGLAKAGNIAQERAAEAKKAADKGNYEAAQKAAKNMNSIAEKAKSDDVQGLEKAESVLNEVMKNAPEEAQQGLQTALDNIRSARQRAGGQPGETPGPGQQPGAETGGEEQAQKNASARMAAARTLMENGRQDLRQGKTAMDNGNFEAARDEFGQASRRFGDAINRIDELDTAEADDLLQRLRDAKSTAEDARASAGNQLDGQDTDTTSGTGGGAP